MEFRQLLALGLVLWPNSLTVEIFDTLATVYDPLSLTLLRR